MTTQRRYLYLLTDGEIFKIGKTNNLKKRRRALIAGKIGKRPLRFVDTWYRPRDSGDIEMYVKSALCHLRVFGHEWFNTTEAEIRFHIDRTMQILDKYNERQLTIERTKAGMAAARERGKNVGRPLGSKNKPK